MSYNMTVAMLLELLSAFKAETPVIICFELEYPDGSVGHWRGLVNNVELDKDEREEKGEVVKISMCASLDMKSNDKWYTVGELIDCLNSGIENKIWTGDHTVIVAKDTDSWYLEHVKICVIPSTPADEANGTNAGTVVVAGLDNYSEG